MSDDDRLWLKRVYNWVHEDARDPRRQVQYLKMVGEWAEKKVLDAQLATVVLPISIATHSTTLLDEKYAILAAIHDALCPCDVQVNPWAQPFDTSLSDAVKAHELDLAECYDDLKRAARQMTEAYQDDINRMLAVVSAGLEKPGGGQVGETFPRDLLNTAVILTKFKVARSTLLRAVAGGQLKSYRSPQAHTNSPHRFSETEVSARYPRR